MIRRTLVLVPVLLLLCSAAALAADDAVKAAPAHFKVLLENDQVRVLEYTAKAGDKIPLHSHPAHVVYTGKSGRTMFTNAEGKKEERTSKGGEATWNPAITHSQVALTDVHAIVIEMKTPKKGY